MVFIPPVPIIRRNLIVKKLKASSAVSEDTAKTLKEANVFNPNGFKPITDRMVEQGVISKTADGKYYIAKH